MDRRYILPIFICAILLGSLIATNFAIAVNASELEKVPVIVGFKDKPDKNLIMEHGGEIKYEYTIIPAIACSLPEPAIDALKKHPKIAYVEVDAVVFAIDAELDDSWGVKRIGAGIVHEYNKGTGVNVSIIDTGIDYNHPDLAANYKGGHDFVNKDADPMDDHGHGTHCAGIVAAEDNDVGVVGVAPEAYLYAVKVLDSQGRGYVSDLVAGIEWSVNNGMQVISMSLGTTSDVQSLHDACDAAYNAGIVLVAAAGNSGNSRGTGDNIVYPAKYTSVIAVGATDKSDSRASWSSTGPALELVAPGVDVNSTWLGGTYAVKSGTSMACPHVSGTAALVMAAYPSWTNVQVREQLQNTADDLGAAGKDNQYGYGLVDAYEAVAEVTEEAEETYPPLGVSITTGTIHSGDITSLYGDDGVYLEVKSAKVNWRSHVIDWYSYVKISQDLSKVTCLTITYDGKYSSSQTQKLYIYDFTSGSWQEIDSRTVGTSDTTITWSTRSPASYISAEGEIKLRVYVSARRSFVCYADFVSYMIKYRVSP